MLVAFADSNECRRECDFWTDSDEQIVSLPRDTDAGPNIVANEKVVRVSLDG